MKILLLDNYDSFTYNLSHLVEKVSGERPDVKKNDAISVEDAQRYDRIILSPGPGLPSDAGIMPQLLSQFHQTKPVLGVCLGLQAIAECFGGKLRNLPRVVHGMATHINVTAQHYLFAGCPARFKVGRYHSWVIDEDTFPPELLVTARDDEGNIMALQHKIFDVCGLQFHPESILSEYGETILRNWLSAAK